MTIYRQHDKYLSKGDKLGVSPPPRSNVYVNAGVFETPWHLHSQHQLIYAERGVIHIQTELKRFLLPAHHGLWIPARQAHSLHSNSAALKVSSVYFEPEATNEDELQQIRIFPMPPLAHEMMMFSQRWVKNREVDELKTSFFKTMRQLVLEWSQVSLSLELPLSNEPLIAAVSEYVLNYLDEPLVLNSIADRFGVSGRTLIRHFQTHLGMTFGRYLQVARIARAAELLTHPAATVTDVSLAVGYRSPSSFSQSFQLLMGQTPSDYLRGKQSLGE